MVFRLTRLFHRIKNGRKNKKTAYPFGCRYWCTELKTRISFPKFYCLVVHEIEI
jgi:hypothetical protein